MKGPSFKSNLRSGGETQASDLKQQTTQSYKTQIAECETRCVFIYCVWLPRKMTKSRKNWTCFDTNNFPFLRPPKANISMTKSKTLLSYSELKICSRQKNFFCFHKLSQKKKTNKLRARKWRKQKNKQKCEDNIKHQKEP